MGAFFHEPREDREAKHGEKGQAEGFKLMARRGSTVQEVFVVTSLAAEELEQRIEACKPLATAQKRALKA